VFCDERSEERGEERSGEQLVVSYCAMQYTVVATLLAPPHLCKLPSQGWINLQGELDSGAPHSHRHVELHGGPVVPLCFEDAPEGEGKVNGGGGEGCSYVGKVAEEGLLVVELGVEGKEVVVDGRRLAPQLHDPFEVTKDCLLHEIFKGVGFIPGGIVLLVVLELPLFLSQALDVKDCGEELGWVKPVLVPAMSAMSEANREKG